MKQLFALNQDRTSFFSRLPPELVALITSLSYDPNPESDIGKALRYAALDNIDTIVVMVKNNPSLLLQAGDVLTRGGAVTRIKLYEFFLDKGDLDSAKKLEFGFAAMPNGEYERKQQYERYSLRLGVRKVAHTAGNFSGCGPL